MKPTPLLLRIWNFYCEALSFSWLARGWERLFKHNPIYPFILFALMIPGLLWLRFYFYRIEGRGIGDRNLAYDFFLYYGWPLLIFVIIMGLWALVSMAYRHWQDKKRPLRHR
jgi:hypothetical protein